MIRAKMGDMVGDVITKIIGLERHSTEVRISMAAGNQFVLYHESDCCESVDLEDFDGCAEDLIGALIVSAEEVNSPEPDGYSYMGDSHTWTFYKIETNKGGLWMRWLGQSNGYYSERVTLGVEPHRLDGPALISEDGKPLWYINGTSYRKFSDYQIAANLSENDITMIKLKYGE